VSASDDVIRATQREPPAERLEDGEDGETTDDGEDGEDGEGDV